MIDSHDIELAHLKKKTDFGCFVAFCFNTFDILFCATTSVVGHENTLALYQNLLHVVPITIRMGSWCSSD